VIDAAKRAWDERYDAVAAARVWPPVTRCSRVWVHVDMDQFYAAVELKDKPELAGAARGSLAAVYLRLLTRQSVCGGGQQYAVHGQLRR
jgi:hypothetical protein